MPDGQGRVDHERLEYVVGVMTRNLNRVMDQTLNPLPEADRSNSRHRPIGIGVQGLADLFLLLRLPFDSPEARVVNLDVFETIYYAALAASCDLAERDGPYISYAGSPASRGLLQFDLWGVQPSARHNWPKLRARIAQFGLRNSLLVAPMPTASTAGILGNTEGIEPVTNNIYTRRVMAGEVRTMCRRDPFVLTCIPFQFTLVNRHLIRDLMERNLWSPEMRKQLVAHRGSVENIADFPADLKPLYKTVWQIKQRALIDLAADRGPFICQSQSLNLYQVRIHRGTDATDVSRSSCRHSRTLPS